MDGRLSDQDLISLYDSGLNIRQISKIDGRGRETIRLILKQHGVQMRFRGIKYRSLSELTLVETASLAGLFGYLLGDGSVSKRKDGRYDCSLSFALDEKEFVEEAKDITRQLFGSLPKVEIVDGCFYKLTFRRSIARFLHEECSYPTGKKSVVNPHVPFWVLGGKREVKISFIRCFFNAEASRNRGDVKIRQSVRIFLPSSLVDRLRQIAKISISRTYKYHWLNWRRVPSWVRQYTRSSNILEDLQKLLLEFRIDAKIYPYWIWASSKNDNVSIHYELFLTDGMARRLKQLNLF